MRLSVDEGLYLIFPLPFVLPVGLYVLAFYFDKQVEVFKFQEKVGLYIAFVGCMFRIVLIGPKFIMKQFPAFLSHGRFVEARGSQDLP